MPRQSNGAYLQPANTAAVSLATITVSGWNTLETDIGGEITNSLDRLGRGGMSAALNMGGFLINSIGNPVVGTDAVNLTTLINQTRGGVIFGVAAGTVNAITATFTPPTTPPYPLGQPVIFQCTGANTSATPTFAPDGAVAKTIVRPAGGPLSPGDIPGGGSMITMFYDPALFAAVGGWRLIGLPSTDSPGTIKMFGMSTLPAGWLQCAPVNNALSTTTYVNLFNAIGYTYGGSGATFGVPVIGGQFIRFWDNGAGVDAARALGSLQADQFQDHTHSYIKSGYASAGAGGGNTVATFTTPVDTTLPDSGSHGAETRAKNIALHAGIKT